VIVGDELVTRDARIEHDATVEIRPVTSGGATDHQVRAAAAAPKGSGGRSPASERPRAGYPRPQRASEER
jgi:hypothetical protein